MICPACVGNSPKSLERKERSRAALAIRRGGFLGGNQFLEDLIECLFALVHAKFTSGLNEPLVLALVSRLWLALLLYACFSHTASQL